MTFLSFPFLSFTLRVQFSSVVLCCVVLVFSLARAHAWHVRLRLRLRLETSRARSETRVNLARGCLNADIYHTQARRAARRSWPSSPGATARRTRGLPRPLGSDLGCEKNRVGASPLGRARRSSRVGKTAQYFHAQAGIDPSDPAFLPQRELPRVQEPPNIQVTLLPYKTGSLWSQKALFWRHLRRDADLSLSLSLSKDAPQTFARERHFFAGTRRRGSGGCARASAATRPTAAARASVRALNFESGRDVCLGFGLFESVVWKATGPSFCESCALSFDRAHRGVLETSLDTS